jgi:hypothetical protein
MPKALVLLLCLLAVSSVALQIAFAQDAERTVSFAEGAWIAEEWTPLRLPLHPEVQSFIQRPDCLGTNSFTEEQKKQALDNVLLMTDTGTDEGEFEVVFRIGPEKGTAPGVFLSPTYTGEELETGIAVFVADYTMAVWLVKTNPETRVTEYDHLVRLARWQDPAAEHVLRCRYSNSREMVALQVDDSDVVILRLPDHEINSKVGIWGCHGTCDFYRMTIRSGGTLPWSGAPPEAQG